MEAKKKYVKPAFRFVTDLGSILECLYEVYGTDGELLQAGKALQETIIYPFLRMIEKKCNEVKVESLHQMLWELYGKNLVKEKFVDAAIKKLQPYLEKRISNE